MKKHFKFLFGMMFLGFVLTGCIMEITPRVSKEVLVQVFNECECRITFKGPAGGELIFFDCRESPYYPMYLEEGTCQVVASNGYEKVELIFVKGKYAQELGIEFR